MIAPCAHEPIVAVEHGSHGLRYRAECKYCDHNHGKWHVTQKAAMADWDEREQSEPRP